MTKQNQKPIYVGFLIFIFEHMNVKYLFYLVLTLMLAFPGNSGIKVETADCVECSSGISVFETADGDLWEAYGAHPEGFSVLVFNTNGTETELDDEIIYFL